MRLNKRRETDDYVYIVIKESTDELYVFKEITPLSELIGLDRSTIYRHFDKNGDKWAKKGFIIRRTINFMIKSRRGG